MTENQNILENISEEQLKEIKIEEVEKLLSLIGDDPLDSADFNFDSLDGDIGKVKSYEVEIMNKLEWIENIEKQKEFIEELLGEVKRIKGIDTINNISNKELDLSIIDIMNRTYKKTEIIEKIENFSYNVGNEYVEHYIENEAYRLKSGGEINNWTYLVLSYIEKQDNILASIFSGTHNEIQDEYINSILGNEKGYNNYFIKGYNNKISNYLIKVSDFEEFLSKGSTKIEGDNDDENVVNSLALSNYISYLIDKGSSYEDFIDKFGLHKLSEINKLWINSNAGGESTLIAKDRLKDTEAWKQIQLILERQENTQSTFDDIDNYSKSILEQEASYLVENLDLIYSIGIDTENKQESINKINKVLELLPEGKKIEINKLNPSIREDFLLHDKIVIGYFEIQDISKEFIEENLENLIRKIRSDEGDLGLLIHRAAILGYNSERLGKIIKDFSITIPPDLSYVNLYIGEMEYISRNRFLEKFKEIEDLENLDNVSDKDKKLLSRYLLRTYKNIESQRYINELIKKNFFGLSGEFFKLPTVNIDIIKNILDNNFGTFPLLSKEARGNSEVIGFFLEKLEKEGRSSSDILEIVFSFTNFMDLSKINNFLQVIKFMDENSPFGGIENAPAEIKAGLLKEKNKSIIISSIKSGLKSNIDKEYIPTFIKVLDLIEENKNIALNLEARDEMRKSARRYNEKERINFSEENNSIEDISEINQEKINQRNIVFDEIYSKIENELGSVVKEKKESIDSTIEKLINDGFSANLTDILYVKIYGSGLSKEEATKVIGIINNSITQYEFQKSIEQQNLVSNITEELEVDNNTNEIQRKFLEVLRSDSEENRKLIKIKDLYEESSIELLKEIDTEDKTDEEINNLIKTLFINKVSEGIQDQNKINEIKIYLDQIKGLEEILKRDISNENYTNYLEEKQSGELVEESYDDYLERNNIDIDYTNLFEEKISKLEYKEDYIDNLNKKIIDNSTNNNSANNEVYNQTIETKSGVYNYETGVIENNGNKIELNNQEKQIVESNPEAIDNIVDFYNLLNDIGLSKLWKIKDQIFNSISNVEGIGFNIDGDYLNENETKIFINKILKSLGIDEIPTVLNIKNFKGEVLDINKTQISGEQERDFIYGETYLEHMFIEKYYPRGSAMELLNTEFENSIK